MLNNVRLKVEEESEMSLKLLRNRYALSFNAYCKPIVIILGKVDAKADDGYFLRYSFVSKAFRVFNIRRQQVEETYNVTFDKSMEAIRFTNTLVDEIGIDDSSRDPPIEFIHKDGPSRHYQANFDISYYVIPHGMLTRSMAAKLRAASASECLFADFLSKIEPKKVSEALKHPGWVDAIQKELNQFYRNKFEKLITKNFKMSMMEELTYFFGLKIKQDNKGISICQEQYTRNLLKKYEISDSFLVKTLMVPPNKLGPKLVGKPVNETSYRGMIGSLMYLTATRPDIQFSIVLCARYQSNPKESHLIAVKRILKYLKGTPTLNLYYPKCSGFDLKGYSDSDYVDCNMDRKSTLGAFQILGGKLVYWSAKKQQSVVMSSVKAEYVVVDGCYMSIIWMKT
uniref:Uncharacterized mitochondrial protein AtMg00810-like n=1 Tax=Tanacetum cinerariifolium TaxID=118510 RepID=A0A6L2NYG2_TANCI|nr:uncharacterized mitochondrial protein AtMg00810-like [Tanacetum cinerariifolium]